MNYRHAFHAGNFADLVKHAALLALLDRMQADPAPLVVIDTHAGRGLYDLAGPEARKSGEAEAGIARLMAADPPPAAFARLIAAVRALNGPGPVRRYPGSPWLIAQALRPGDTYLACELKAEEHAALREHLKGRGGVRTLQTDGYAAAATELPRSGQVLVLIDPPFEQADDYARIAGAVRTIRARRPDAIFLVWLPLKDLETFDAFLRSLEDEVGTPALIAETRMRPLSDPMKMNGCALALIPGPVDLRAEFEAICAWTAANLGEAGLAKVYTI